MVEEVGMGVGARRHAPVKPVQFRSSARGMVLVVLPPLLLALPLQCHELVDGKRAHWWAWLRSGLAGGEHEAGDVEQRRDVVGRRPVRLAIGDELTHVPLYERAKLLRREDAGEAVHVDPLHVGKPTEEAEHGIAVVMHLRDATATREGTWGPAHTRWIRDRTGGAP